MCCVLCSNTRNCCDDSCTTFLPIILDPRVLWIPHHRAIWSSSYNVWVCGPISTVSTWQYSKHRRSSFLSCWSEVQSWNSLSTIRHTEGTHMCSVHQVIPRWQLNTVTIVELLNTTHTRAVAKVHTHLAAMIAWLVLRWILIRWLTCTILIKFCILNLKQLFSGFDKPFKEWYALSVQLEGAMVVDSTDKHSLFAFCTLCTVNILANSQCLQTSTLIIGLCDTSGYQIVSPWKCSEKNSGSIAHRFIKCVLYCYMPSQWIETVCILELAALSYNDSLVLPCN